MKTKRRRIGSDPLADPIGAGRLAKMSEHSLRMVLKGCMIGMDLCFEDADKFRHKARSVLQELEARERKAR